MGMLQEASLQADQRCTELEEEHAAALLQAQRRCTQLEEGHAAVLLQAQRRCTQLEEEHVAALLQAEWRYTEFEEEYAARCWTTEESDRRVAEMDSMLVNAIRMECEIFEESQAAERRAWTLAEVANEVAWRADLREVRVLEGEVEMK